MKRVLSVITVVFVVAVAGACKKDPAAVPAPAPAPFPGSPTGGGSSTPPSVVSNVPPPAATVPVDQPIVSGNDPIASASIETINRDSPLQAVFFAYDSDTLDEKAKAAMANNAQVLRKYPTWIVTIEGHCDERGTTEYNLALGDRRAQAVKNYMVSLGISADRFRTVSYGNEFPFAPGHDESAWSLNRRAHFMLMAKQ
jgi:peptidoglycan-associated lipoprotein